MAGSPALCHISAWLHTCHLDLHALLEWHSDLRSPVQWKKKLYLVADTKKQLLTTNLLNVQPIITSPMVYLDPKNCAFWSQFSVLTPNSVELAILSTNGSKTSFRISEENPSIPYKEIIQCSATLNHSCLLYWPWAWYLQSDGVTLSEGHACLGHTPQLITEIPHKTQNDSKFPQLHVSEYSTHFYLFFNIRLPNSDIKNHSSVTHNLS